MDVKLEGLEIGDLVQQGERAVVRMNWAEEPTPEDREAVSVVLSTVTNAEIAKMMTHKTWADALAEERRYLTRDAENN